MFTKKEKQMLGGGYFTIIREEEKFIEVRSNNTKHQWIIFKKSIDSNKPVTLFHKHTADTKYYPSIGRPGWLPRLWRVLKTTYICN